ncbi:MAG: N-acetyltransferase [Rhodocyclaceae bacterium]|nr:N-acetyltransferase [Rhodocyclaceae bacterium]
MPSHFKLLDRISQIQPEAWDALHDGHPGLRHAFLEALESNGCTGPGTGWLPAHAVLLRDASLVAAMPLYLKEHSYGEYVFDWAWADAYQRNGIAYYPKWLSAIPFSPLPGNRLLGRTAGDRATLLDAVLAQVKESGASSLHILFPGKDEAELMTSRRMLVREGVQFHWHNAGYRDFEAFLTSLNHEKRKKIRQERRRLEGLTLSYRWLDGHQASEEHWRFFYSVYAQTYRLHRSTPYLNEAFFIDIASRMPEQVRLLLVEENGKALAGAFFLCDGSALYGRYWGASRHIPNLHFEVCYYRAIDYCIQLGLARMEGGAQGEHKLSRGLTPVQTRSAHWIADSRFRDALDHFLARERAGVGLYLDELAERSPFRQSTQTGHT